MNRFFSRSPISSKQNISPKESQVLFSRKFQQLINSEQDFVRNVGFFLEKLKANDVHFIHKTVDRIKSQIKNSKSLATEKFLALLLLKTLFECDETQEVAQYSSNKILRRLRIIAEKTVSSKSKSPFFFRRTTNVTFNENKAFSQLLLECLKFWGFKYKPHLLEKGINEYRQTYQDLVKKGVVFPENYKFFWKQNPFSTKNLEVNRNQKEEILTREELLKKSQEKIKEIALKEGFIKEEKKKMNDENVEFMEKTSKIIKNNENLDKSEEFSKERGRNSEIIMENIRGNHEKNEEVEQRKNEKDEPYRKRKILEKTQNEKFELCKNTLENEASHENLENNENFIENHETYENNEKTQEIHETPQKLLLFQDPIKNSLEISPLKLYTPRTPSKSPMKSHKTLIKSRSLNDLFLYLTPASRPAKLLESDEKPSNLKGNNNLQSLNLEDFQDFLSKVSSDDLSPLQTPQDTRTSMKDIVSFQQLSSIELKKLDEKHSFTKKIEGILTETQKKSLFLGDDLKERLNITSKASIEENFVARSEEKMIKFEENGGSCLDFNKKIDREIIKCEEKHKENQDFPIKSFRYDDFSLDSLRKTPLTINPITEDIEISAEKPGNLIEKHENCKKSEKLYEKTSESMNYEAIIHQKDIEIDALRKDFQDLTHFSICLRSQLEQSLIKNADLTLNIEALRRENSKLHDYKREYTALSEKMNDYIHLKKNYEELQFQYESLVNEKMDLEIQRKKLKAENQRINENYEGLLREKDKYQGFSRENRENIENNYSRKQEKQEFYIENSKKTDFDVEKREFSIENSKNDSLDIPNKKQENIDFTMKKHENVDFFERKCSISSSEAPNFYINKSYDFRSKTRKLKKRYSFCEKSQSQDFEFQYVEGKTLDNDLLRIEKLIKTDKFIQNPEIFKNFCIFDKGKVVETDALEITYEYLKVNDKEIILGLSFLNKTDIEISSFQTKVLNPRSKSYIYIYYLI